MKRDPKSHGDAAITIEQHIRLELLKLLHVHSKDEQTLIDRAVRLERYVLDGDAPAFRRAVIEECWGSVDALIVRGELSGNGCDDSAQRNGIVLAANALHSMLNAKDEKPPQP
jgi:hypothetical protein